MSAAISKQTPAAEVSPNTATGVTTPTRRKTQPLGLNAKRVISKRYSLKDAKGRALEEWPDIVRRVVGHVSAAEKEPRKRDEFFAAMSDVMLAREFVPNTPCLVNAGKTNGQLAACFVLDVPDSITGIMEHAKAAATIHQTGGGTGMSPWRMMNEWGIPTVTGYSGTGEGLSADGSHPVLDWAPKRHRWSLPIAVAARIAIGTVASELSAAPRTLLFPW